ncbi:hypothetical protein HanXRQr2_Chr04g0186181 [Helianthus annuus]|uniref:Uncharacterized protein n=1 Tax=Helianthus annuus TaxID=4232 RepID=A0A9K3NTA3_HELAN|nr:hypothetical protein HanXRQr2_Chr04g0186181 [Helianthus annuus]
MEEMDVINRQLLGCAQRPPTPILSSILLDTKAVLFFFPCPPSTQLLHPMGLLLLPMILLSCPVLSLLGSPFFPGVELPLFPFSCFSHDCRHVIIDVVFPAMLTPTGRSSPINHILHHSVRRFIVTPHKPLPWGPLPLFFRLVFFITFFRLFIITLSRILILEPSIPIHILVLVTN